jgi:23S rRNA (cytidine1920-2'-O)/16S rRNA (cytidine1409-2'-O)-methyltransferase
MRLDQALVERKLAASRTLAQKLIESGVVTVSGVVTNKPSRKIEGSEPIEVTQQMPFISRGGEKLAHALDFFQVNASGLDCLDVGASTGGFTDCLLKRGAGQVFCVDSGSNQLHQTLRDHPKVSFREGFNARFMTPDDLPFLPQLVVMDVSFISQTLLLTPIAGVLKKNGAVVSLIKPQFELSSAELGRNGIVREEELREKAIQRVRSAAEEIGFQWHGLTESPIQGGGGNREFLCYLTR